MKRFQSLTLILTLVLIILASLTASCDKRNPPPIIPTPTQPPSVKDIRVFHRIWATPDTIYADSNITYAKVSVEVRDGEGFGVPNQIVQFKASPIGRVLTYVATDSTGIATTTLWDDGKAGEATVTAIVRKYHASVTDSLISEDTISIPVMIKPTPPVQSVTLGFKSTADPFPMFVSETTPVSATALNELGNNVPNGTLIAFSCIKGKFVDISGNDLGQHVTQATVNGRASVLYNSGTSSTTAVDDEQEYVVAAIGEVTSTRQIQIKPGTPSSIELQSYVVIDGVESPSVTSEVGSTNHIFIEGTVRDLHGNRCQNQSVKFGTDLGTFVNTTQQISLPTNTSGLARVRFTPGLSAGAATITASANNDTVNTQLIFTITSDKVYSLDFTQQNMIALNVANTGGASSAILRVKLRDINYNLIDAPQNVYFRIMNSNPPAGANVNNAPVTDSVLVISNGGEAQVSVNAGTQSGVLFIRASCVTEDGRWIQATKPNIVIHAGPPHYIEPFISGFNTGDPMGGGVWQVVAGAAVKDVNNNPVQKGTSVYFSVYGAGAGPGYYPATTANIVATASVGNVSIKGDSLEGTAYTSMTYNGLMTNEIVTIRALCGDGSGNDVVWFEEVQLPLNDPRLEAQCDPAFLNFGQTGPATKEADIFITLRDGQGLLITGTEIMVLSTRGQIIFNPNYPWPNYDLFNPIPSRVYSNSGRAYSRIKVYLNEFPFGDAQTNTPSSTDVNVIVRILGAGADLSITAPLTVYRYAGNPPF